MTTVRCSRGHINPSDHRFCALCGEKLTGAAGYQGLILGDRYRIVRELGHGGFGRTYLAEDINRFNESCVLKEFAPQVRGTEALHKAEELFEREAGVLYKLQHPQIPRFRELFRARLNDQVHLFLVQDYIEGRTYRQLLDARMAQNLYFLELEVRRLLEQILPVLQYLHAAGVIHRDISPDNLILRSSDQLPVLIDFGGVKQIAVAATSMYLESSPVAASPATRLGKLGYAPEGQLQRGVVSPQSDLYALAVTALVLLTGKDPLDLLDNDGARKNWQNYVSLSSNLTRVLTQMLAFQPEIGVVSQNASSYQSAQEALQALYETDSPVSAIPPAASDPYQGWRSTDMTASKPISNATHNAIHNATHHTTYEVAVEVTASRAIKQRRAGLGALLLVLLLGTGMGAAGWWTRDRWLPLVSSLITQVSNLGQNSGQGSDQGSDQGSAPAAPDSLESRSQALRVDYLFLIKLTDVTFRQRYPEQQGRTLSEGAEDAEWRKRWRGIANEWLTLLKQNLSSEARSQLGSYTKADREQWKQEVNQLYVGSRSLFALADAKFFHLFPQQRGQTFIDQPIGQVWQAIAADQVKALQTGKTLERLQFDPGAFSKTVGGTLAPGEGRIDLANLSEGQLMRLSLEAPRHSTRLSIYLPRPTSELPELLDNSNEMTWSGKLPQSGYYEIVVVNRTADPIRYQLSLAVDNLTSTPVEPEQPEVPKAKN